MSINFQLLSFEFLNEKHPNFFQEIILRKYFMERTTIGISICFSPFYRLGVIQQLVHAPACVHRDMKQAGSLESTKDA